jgi:hypothetical protein
MAYYEDRDEALEKAMAEADAQRKSSRDGDEQYRVKLPSLPKAPEGKRGGTMLFGGVDKYAADKASPPGPRSAGAKLPEPPEPKITGSDDALAATDELSAALSSDEGPPAPEDAPAAVEPPPPGKYGAEGDPWTYEVQPDGSIRLSEGGRPKGSVGPEDDVYSAIVAQMKSGQLTREPSRDERLDGALADLAE